MAEIVTENKEPIFTVSDITRLIKRELEQGFPSVQIEGELSNVRPAASGHLYFSLKDNDAMLSCVMFKNRTGYLRFDPADGILAVARGGISVYQKRGNYQLVCESLRQSGEGTILAMLEERKRKLSLIYRYRVRPISLC